MNEKTSKALFICSRDTLDGVYPVLVYAINALRNGCDVKVFCTLMGIHLIHRRGLGKIRFYPPGFMGAIPGMSRVGAWMMKRMVERAHEPDLEDTLTTALMEGVQFVACRMTLDMMKIREEDLIENVPVWKADELMAYAEECRIAMFM